MKYDVLVIGCGFSGATAARILAENGKKVLIIEKRNHIGGNMYECISQNGIAYHKYGPHIFHTNNEDVYNFIIRFGKWKKYIHKVIGNIDGKLVPIPFNYKSIDILLPKDAEKIKDTLKSEYGDKENISILTLLENSNSIISDFGHYVYDKVFAQYTAKQWNISIDKIDKSVINRVPVVLSYKDSYFSDKYQLLPKDSYNKIFENILSHNNITVELNSNAVERLEISDDEKKIYFDGKETNIPIIYTGALDELCKYKFGSLPYRSLNLEFQNMNIDSFQGCAIVNYNTSEKFTRITEFKYLTNQKIKNNTVILKEYPQQYEFGKNEAFYPINNIENNALYLKYVNYLSSINNFYPLGRLAEYKYYNMDLAILSAINKSKEIIN